MSLLVVMGSGETAPTMIKPHRAVLAAGPDATGAAAMLDTPFGFQMNADELVEKTQTYFRQSVGLPVEVACWRRADAPVLQRERALTVLRQARWVFAGPGSPSYALRQWQDTGVPAALLDVAARGGSLVFGSAAACTLGTHAIPVYEIYKVGEDPRWLSGLDLLGSLTGLRAAVIPHYDNAEGGGHDTRYCYLGEQRLTALEAELPDDVGVLGVDEHTALVIDLEAGAARIEGNGVVTARRRGRSVRFGAGETVTLARLGAILRGEAAPADAPAGAEPTHPSGESGPRASVGDDQLPSLRREADTALADFDTALAAADVDGCVGAVLALEESIVAWSADTDVNDDTAHARSLLRGMVVRLGELARVGARDPREPLAPLVDLLLSLRARARTDRDWATSDLVRDGLADAGVQVRDTPEGPQWELADAAATTSA